jgi:hypothetical protein
MVGDVGSSECWREGSGLGAEVIKDLIRSRLKLVIRAGRRGEAEERVDSHRAIFRAARSALVGDVKWAKASRCQAGDRSASWKNADLEVETHPYQIRSSVDSQSPWQGSLSDRLANCPWQSPLQDANSNAQDATTWQADGDESCDYSAELCTSCTFFESPRTKSRDSVLILRVYRSYRRHECTNWLFS